MTDIEPEQNPHARAIIAALEAADLTVGDGVAPKSADAKQFVAPCVVLYTRAGGFKTGTLAQPDVDGDMRFQLTAVGRLAAEARQYADRAHDALKAHPIDVDGRLICRVRRLWVASTIERDEDVTRPLFYLPVEYGLFTLSRTPAVS